MHFQAFQASNNKEAPQKVCQLHSPLATMPKVTLIRWMIMVWKALALCTTLSFAHKVATRRPTTRWPVWVSHTRYEIHSPREPCTKEQNLLPLSQFVRLRENEKTLNSLGHSKNTVGYTCIKIGRIAATEYRFPTFVPRPYEKTLLDSTCVWWLNHAKKTWPGNRRPFDFEKTLRD